MGNRVEDLEQQVTELQAAVDGLTEELVETKERISQLEAATSSPEPDSGSDSHAEFVPNASATAEATSDESSADEPDPSTGDATDADDAASDDVESEESDDIIVA